MKQAFEICPVCGKKGWCDDFPHLSQYGGKRCRYCGSSLTTHTWSRTKATWVLCTKPGRIVRGPKAPKPAPASVPSLTPSVTTQPLVESLRKLATDATGTKVSLPATSPDQWPSDQNAPYVPCDLSEVLQFIADMLEN